MNKIVHISAEIIDALKPHKITKKNSARLTRIHNALDTINALHIFSFPDLPLVDHQKECVNKC